MVIRCHVLADMYGRNSRALFRVIIKNNEVGSRRRRAGMDLASPDVEQHGPEGFRAVSSCQ
jgi:hypothetical protein